jgi:hypothetical protein
MPPFFASIMNTIYAFKQKRVKATLDDAAPLLNLKITVSAHSLLPKKLA